MSGPQFILEHTIFHLGRGLRYSWENPRDGLTWCGDRIESHTQLATQWNETTCRRCLEHQTDGALERASVDTSATPQHRNVVLNILARRIVSDIVCQVFAMEDRKGWPHS